MKERFVQLYGDEMAGEFLAVRKESRVLTVTGFVSNPGFTRATRSHQVIFINRRPVKNATVNHAVYDVYRDHIAGDRHPAYFLFIQLDPGNVDINVHPAKREVRFEKPDDIHRFVRAAVYEALNPGHEVDLSAPFASKDFFHKRTYGAGFSAQDAPAVSDRLSGMFTGTSQTDIFSAGITSGFSPFFHIGESFVAHVSADGLVIIDQHAAHERILYEKFLHRTAIETETLVLPIRVELPVKHYNLIIRHQLLLNSMGLDTEDFGNGNIIVRSIPRELKKADVRGLLLDIADSILEQETSGIHGGVTEQSLLKDIAARLACHKSVRGSEPLNNEELARLMSDLDRTDAPDRCPHGRPTRLYFSLDHLNKLFKRK
jgi:DNA mismatch repair protein MutL